MTYRHRAHPASPSRHTTARAESENHRQQIRYQHAQQSPAASSKSRIAKFALERFANQIF